MILQQNVWIFKTQSCDFLFEKSAFDEKFRLEIRDLTLGH